jgi:hypothetical protein
MELANMRENGVRALYVNCLDCGHEADFGIRERGTFRRLVINFDEYLMSMLRLAKPIGSVRMDVIIWVGVCASVGLAVWMAAPFHQR